MKDVEHVLHTVENYAFWVMIAIGMINICWSFLMIASDQPPKGGFQCFEVVSLVSSILLGILIVRMARMDAYLDCAEDIAGNVCSGMLAFANLTISIVWLIK